MKSWLLAGTVIAVAISAAAIDDAHAAPQFNTEVVTPANIDNTTWINANELLMFIGNTGSFAYDKSAYLGKSDGLHYPGHCPQTLLYAAGLWMGAMVGGDVRVAVAEYSDEFVPGGMSGGQPQPDDPSFRVYKIQQGDTPATNPDYAEWPIDQGAPGYYIYDTVSIIPIDVDTIPVPLLLGDQALWCVFNDADTAAHDNMSTDPLGVEIRLYAFAYDQDGPLGRTIFLHYTIINNGENSLNNAYVSLWADPDLGDAGDDFVGCDIGRNLDFCYNDGADVTYGENPPAVGFEMLYGPTVPDTDGSAFSFRRRTWIDGIRNLPMTSFSKYINGTDPHDGIESYNYMQGLNRDGSVIIDPTTAQPTKFWHSGDPVTGTGWLDMNSSDRRNMMSSGPFSMTPGDTQEVVAAVVVGSTEEYDCIVPLFVDTLHAAHIAGDSEGDVYALVLDPTATTGHDYQVTFEGTYPDVTWSLYDETAAVVLLTDQPYGQSDEERPIIDGLMVKVIDGMSFGIDQIIETANGSGPVVPPDNVAYSLNSTGDWYVTSDQTNNFDRMNWQGLIGMDDWEIRFTSAGSECYDFTTDEKFGDRAPFEVWNIGSGTPDDPSDDQRVQFSVIDDDGSGGWSMGDRIYVVELAYIEPLPQTFDFDANFPQNFHIGRIVFNDNSGNGTPAEGTVARFVTNKTITANEEDDVFAFTAPPASADAMPMARTAADAFAGIIDLRYVADSARSFFAQQFAGPCDCPDHGDWNNDGIINLIDIVKCIDYLYRGGLPPFQYDSCPVSVGNVNCLGEVDILDAVYLIDYAFRNGAAPCDPCTATEGN